MMSACSALISRWCRVLTLSTGPPGGGYYDDGRGGGSRGPYQDVGGGRGGYQDNYYQGGPRGGGGGGGGSRGRGRYNWGREYQLAAAAWIAAAVRHVGRLHVVTWQTHWNTALCLQQPLHCSPCRPGRCQRVATVSATCSAVCCQHAAQSLSNRSKSATTTIL
jgi:hypothetical protein